MATFDTSDRANDTSGEGVADLGCVERSWSPGKETLTSRLGVVQRKEIGGADRVATREAWSIDPARDVEETRATLDVPGERGGERELLTPAQLEHARHRNARHWHEWQRHGLDERVFADARPDSVEFALAVARFQASTQGALKVDGVAGDETWARKGVTSKATDPSIERTRGTRAADGAEQRAQPGAVDRDRADSIQEEGARLPLQAKADGAVAADDEQVHQLARAGTRDRGGTEPHADAIKAAFGDKAHVVDETVAHVDGAASAASKAMGAQAFATGNHVAFDGTPSLHTAAHEMAHVVQQRQGVSLKGGVGATGDTYEQHADAVADRVERGRSAQDLFATHSQSSSNVVQREEIAASEPAAAVQRKDRSAAADVAEARSAHADYVAYEATKRNLPIDARTYLHAVKDMLLPALGAFLGQRVFELAPGIRWAHEPHVVGMEIVKAFADAYHDIADGLVECLRGVDVFELVDRSRAVTGATDGEDEARRALGPPVWSPSVASTLAPRLEEALLPSTPRMSARYRDLHIAAQAQAVAAMGSDANAAAVTVAALIPSAPIDRVVARALCAPQFVIVDAPAPTAHGAKAAAPTVPRAPRRIHHFVWQGAVDPKLWNWVRVIDPADATVEEVAATILDDGGPGDAHAQADRIVAAPPLFGIPVDVARQRPEAALFERGQPKTVFAVAPNPDSAVALGASAITDDIAVAQGRNAATARVDVVRAAGEPVAAHAHAAPEHAEIDHRAAVLDGLAAIESQLDFIMSALSPFGLGGAVVPGRIHAGEQRARLANAGDDEIARWAPAISEQKTLLREVSGDIGQVVEGAKKLGVRAAGDPGAKPYLDVLAAFARVAATSHLVETARSLLAPAQTRARTLVAEVVEQMVGDTASQAETTRFTIGAPSNWPVPIHQLDRLDGDQEILAMGKGRKLSAQLRTASADIEQRVAALRARALRGEPVDPAEIESIMQQADVVRFASSIWNDLTTLWSLRELADDETSGKWNWLLNTVTFSKGDLERIHDKSAFLANALESIQKQLAFEQHSLGAWVATEMSHAPTSARDAAVETQTRTISAKNATDRFRERFAKLEQQLHDLGKDQSIAEFVNWAYDKIRNAEFRKAIAQLAVTIGVTIVTDGVGELAGGLAEGLGAGERIAGLTQLVTSTGALSTFTAATTKGESFSSRFVFDMLTNLATSGALKAWGEATGRLSEEAAVMWERGGAVWRIARGTFRFTSDAIITMGVQFSVGQFERAVRSGQQPTTGDAEEWLMQGAAIAIGHGVSAALRPMKARFLDLPGRGAALGHRATEVLGLAEHAEATGDRAAAQRAVIEMAELAREEQEYLRVIADDHATIRKLGIDEHALQRLVSRAEKDVERVHSPEMTELMLKVGLDEAVPGRVYLGDRANIELSANELAARGATIERIGEPGREEIHARLGEKEYVLKERAEGARTQDRVLLAGDDARLREAAEWLAPLPGTLDVIVHGEIDDFVVLISGQRVHVDHRRLALYIKKNGGEFTRVRLVSCKTGMHPKGVAQHLANKLGVEVIAPTDLLYLQEDGSHVIGPRPTRNTGTWETFKPTKSSFRYKQVDDAAHASAENERAEAREPTVAVGDDTKPSATGARGQLSVSFVEKVFQHHLGLILPDGARPIDREGGLFVDLGEADHHAIVRVAVSASVHEGSTHSVTEEAGTIEIRIASDLSTEEVGPTLAGAFVEARQIARHLKPDAANGGDTAEAAKVRYLLAQLDESTALPGDARDTRRMRADLDERLSALGIDRSAAGKQRALALFASEPAVAKRVELHLDGLTSRPNVGASTGLDAYKRGSAEYLGELRDLVGGDGAPELVSVESKALGSQLRLEESRRLFEPLGLSSPTIRADAQAAAAIDRAAIDMTALINDANVTSASRGARVIARIDQLQADPAIASIREQIDFGRMRAHARTLGRESDEATGLMTLDVVTGAVFGAGQGTQAPTSIRRLMSEVDIANQTAMQNGLGIQFVIVMHSPVAGADGHSRAAIEVISRPLPRYRLPAENPSQLPAAGNAPDELTIDVGVGRGNFAAEKLAPGDRQGMIVQSEYIGLAEAAQRKRSTAGTADAGPLQIPGAVVIYGDILMHPELLAAGPGDAPTAGIRRVLLNNVSAKLKVDDYRSLAEGLGKALADDGIIEVQWDMSAEDNKGTPRGHIEGEPLVEALKEFSGRDVRVEGSSTSDYDYTLNTAGSSAPDPSKLRQYRPPRPQERRIIHLGPRRRSSP